MRHVSVVSILLGDNQPCEGAAQNLETMSGEPKLSATGACPFCGVAAPVPHETQEGCIEALHSEIGRMRDVLAALRPAGTDPLAEVSDTPAAAAIRLLLD